MSFKSLSQLNVSSDLFSETGFLVCSEMSDSAIKFCFRLDITQRKICKNSAPTETVFCQGPGFFGGLRHFQMDESQLKITSRWKAFSYKKSLMSLKSGILCVHRSSLDSQNAWGRVEFESHHSDFDQ
ncbi:hypothetical protein TNCV_272141 [Trichonephila clavipes]|nr:hypothetical protein TNCV_272141 [Trichonephila clavipes]